MRRGGAQLTGTRYIFSLKCMKFRSIEEPPALLPPLYKQGGGVPSRTKEGGSIERCMCVCGVMLLLSSSSPSAVIEDTSSINSETGTPHASRVSIMQAHQKLCTAPAARLAAYTTTPLLIVSIRLPQSHLPCFRCDAVLFSGARRFPPNPFGVCFCFRIEIEPTDQTQPNNPTNQASPISLRSTHTDTHRQTAWHAAGRPSGSAHGRRRSVLGRRRRTLQSTPAAAAPQQQPQAM
jgi:hypothetical protein